jgi:hypothetical protein
VIHCVLHTRDAHSVMRQLMRGIRSLGRVTTAHALQLDSTLESMKRSGAPRGSNFSQYITAPGLKL